MSASLNELKRRLAAAQQRADKLSGAIKRFRRFAKWARKAGLKKLAASLTERAGAYSKQRDEVRKRIADLRERIRNFDPPVPPVVDGGWHPKAERVQVQPNGSGGFIGVPPKLVWHTTEGVGLPTYSGSAPHFTIDPKTGKLWQHVPINRAAFALLHPSGTVETNHANAIQVEQIGFASQTQDWSDDAYRHIAELARWIEKHAGVKRACTVKFGDSGNLPPRLSSDAWLKYQGHLGHQHVPVNEHWDPGAFRIDKVI